MKPGQDNLFLTRFLMAHPLSRSSALGASDNEFLDLLKLLETEHLSPNTADALMRLMTAIDINLNAQELLRGPSLAEELIAERRAEAARENDQKKGDTLT
jgi:hypothetical protein